TRSYRDLQWLLTCLTALAAFIAFHTLVQGVTGRFLFATENQSDYLSAVSGFHLSGSTVTRAGSFLINPDWNGLYLAMSLFPAAGLIFTGATRAWRIFAAATCGLVLLALLFTFTTSSWLAASVGFVFFLFIGVPKRYRWWMLGGLITMMLVIWAVFFKQVALLYAHATASNETTLRLGAWETALRIIRADPFTGIGMGYNLYLDRAERFRVALQTQALAHPHNSYLELAAFAGLPVLLAFLALLGMMGADVVRAYRRSDRRQKPLFGGVIAALIVLSVNSLFINGWTLPPFVCLGWLLIGAVTSRAVQAAQADAARIAPLPASLKPNKQEQPAAQQQRGRRSGLPRRRGNRAPGTSSDASTGSAQPTRAEVAVITMDALPRERGA
ncbi:MAG: O-antigen ligase family protein, partial [Ktedonobacterales bacterium]